MTATNLLLTESSGVWLMGGLGRKSHQDEEEAGVFLLLFLPWWLLFHAYCFILIFTATIPHGCYFNSNFMGHKTKSWEHTEQVPKRERAHRIWFRIWKIRHTKVRSPQPCWGSICNLTRASCKTVCLMAVLTLTDWDFGEQIRMGGLCGQVNMEILV